MVTGGGCFVPFVIGIAILFFIIIMFSKL
jgi:hypothetical protein